MRRTLQTQDGKRKKFQGVFARFGKKTNFHGYAEDTILLQNILDVETNKIVADHVWFTRTKNFQKLSLAPGVHIEFEARIKKYTKGYVNSRYKIDRRENDYKLSHPSKICVKAS